LFEDEAPTTADYYAGLCALAEASARRVPDLVHVARAFGLPPPDEAALERFHADLLAGRIPTESTAATIRERYYVPQAAGRSRAGASASERSTLDWTTRPSAPPVATPSRNGDAPWFIGEPAPGAEDGSPDEREHERAWSDKTITVANSVLSRIEREIREATWAFGTNVETGGWLYAHYAPDADGILIIAATGPGPSGEHAVGRLRLSHPRELEDELFAGAVLVGDWHSHPWTWAGDPSDQASKGDEEAWGHRLETVASCSPWVGLVFTPGGTTPVFHGFLTHKNEHGVVVCEQAIAVEAGISWP
jgi:hypothetical protein